MPLAVAPLRHPGQVLVPLSLSGLLGDVGERGDAWLVGWKLIRAGNHRSFFSPLIRDLLIRWLGLRPYFVDLAAVSSSQLRVEVFVRAG
jgi:hypothetical protein